MDYRLKRLINKEIEYIESFSLEHYEEMQQYKDVMEWDLQGAENAIFDAGQLNALKELKRKLKNNN